MPSDTKLNPETDVEIDESLFMTLPGFKKKHLIDEHSNPKSICLRVEPSHPRVHWITAPASMPRCSFCVSEVNDRARAIAMMEARS